jgi:UDP-N-acetyl-D-mannosaminuronate dehydrogenase
VDLSKIKVVIIRLAYCGLSLIAESGKTRPTLGYDVNESRVDELRKGLNRAREVTDSQLLDAKHLEPRVNEMPRTISLEFISKQNSDNKRQSPPLDIEMNLSREELRYEITVTDPYANAQDFRELNFA